MGSALGPLTALCCVIVLFTVLDSALGSGQFATFENFQAQAVQNLVLGVAALGMTLIIIAGGIDLSAGTAMTLCATTLAWGIHEDVGFMGRHMTNFNQASLALQDAQRNEKTAKDATQGEYWRKQIARRRATLVFVLELKHQQVKSGAESAADRITRREQERMQRRIGEKIASLADDSFVLNVDKEWQQDVPNSPWTGALAVLLGVGTGIAAGMLNGLLISTLRVVPFVVTLGTMSVFLGLGNLISNNVPIAPTVAQIPRWLESLASGEAQFKWLGFPSGFYLLILLAVAVSLLLRYTVFGRHVFALGSNENTARLCGINVPATKIAVYALGGLFFGIAGLLHFSKLGESVATAGFGQELKVIAAVVIGGASLSGGRGTVLGSIAGTVMIAIISSGCTQLGWQNSVELISLGAIIIGAVAIDQWRLRRAEA
jgi:ribose/xylose/arabinose/galactoside ABC-type transport system permease subunit